MIRSGISKIRNPILVSYAAKGLLPYRGLGSGIKRALAEWPEISFTDDRDGSMFIATVHREGLDDMESAEKGSQKSSQKGSQKSSQKIIELMKNDPKITVANLALLIGITERAIKKQIGKLKAQGRIRRIGPDKGGSWEVAE
ncbi:MAG: winged helix-turn-helix domain-containing protein [Methanothrix sp.]